MLCKGCSVACILLLCTLGNIQLISAQDVDQIVDATNQVKQGLLSKIGLGTVAVVPATVAPTSTIPVTPTTAATPPTTASPVTTAAVTTATTPTTTAAPSTTAAASTKPATTSTATPTTTNAPTTTSLPATTAAATTKPATTPPPTTACPIGSILVNMVCVLTCPANSTPTNPCANNAYPLNSNQIDYQNNTPGDVTCEMGTDGNYYVTYTHSTKIKCTSNADCISGNAAGGAVCSMNNAVNCHQGASPSLCPASGRKLLHA